MEQAYERSKSEKVLIVEDDLEIASIISMNIKDLGLETEHASDGRVGLNMAFSGKFSLVILDIMLPKLDGISICRKIREKDSYTPIMMLTAKADEIDRVLGLELGADDYMTKPFSVRELNARVRALLRRSQVGTNTQSQPGGASLCIGDLKIEFDMRKVMLMDETIELTVKEFDLLALFASNPGRAYSRADLLNIIWGYQFEGYEHTVNTHINRLRNKIESEPAEPRYLKTVWGVGYRFAEKSEFPECS
ncbi:MAG: response regulator transcription factor [Spirochaetales bacterium]|nr:response regulator transcription factor [Spirochaetales bacterium]